LNQREEPLPFVVRVEVVGKGPELRHHHEVEDPHPEEEGDAEWHAGGSEHEEHDETGHEEQCDPVDQRAPGQAASQAGIQRHGTEENQGLRRRCVALHFGAALADD
jgi:hypothetical protein